MEPEIRFCTSADGTRIAYSTLGEPAARALVFVPTFDSGGQEVLFKNPELLALLKGLASGRRFVTFDRRGVGDSQREVSDLGIPAQVDDLSAVVDRLGLESFDLMGSGHGAPLAGAYAAKHPERVGRLVLWHPLGPLSDPYVRRVRALVQSIRLSWSLARRSWSTITHPKGPPDVQREFSNMLRDSIAPEVAARHFEAILTFDVSTILPSVRAPAVVLAMSDARDIEDASVRAVASLISDAHLVMLEGGWGNVIADPSELLAAIRTFLDGADAESEAIEAQRVAGLVTILFTDIESSTALTQRLGDAKVQELLRTHNAIVRDALKECGGSEIKHTGDGIMASFPSASAALKCAVAIQRAVAALRQAQGEQAEPVEAALRVRIGLNAGEPVVEEDDLFGASVQLARRVCDQAEPGQIVASNVVRELATGKGFLFSDLGDVVPKGFEEPVRLFEVGW